MTKNQNSRGIGHQKLGISTEKGREGIIRQENAKNLDRGPSSQSVEEPIDRFVGAGNLKRPPHVISLTILLHPLKTLHILASRDHFGLDFGLIEGFGVDFGTYLS